VPVAGEVYAGLGRLYYEWNDLETAAKYIQSCIDIGQQTENFDLLAEGYLLVAQLDRAKCDAAQAQEALQHAEQAAGKYALSKRRAIYLKSAIVGLQIAQGLLEIASFTLQQGNIMIDDEIPVWKEPEYYALLRLLLARGDYDAALRLGQHLLANAETAGRIRRLIEVLILQALAYKGKGDLTRALDVLEKAFRLARPEGLVRIFLDEGEPMMRLLHQARSSQTGGEYAGELLSAGGWFSRKDAPPVQSLIEPLTARELEVFRLIEAGHSNQEIAARLFISITTVKRHISNIYTKLGAQSRTRAITLGRDLGLFD
jgi:LuxR family maltose regulon positive regulatory protein